MKITTLLSKSCPTFKGASDFCQDNNKLDRVDKEHSRTEDRLLGAAWISKHPTACRYSTLVEGGAKTSADMLTHQPFQHRTALTSKPKLVWLVLAVFQAIFDHPKGPTSPSHLGTRSQKPV